MDARLRLPPPKTPTVGLTCCADCSQSDAASRPSPSPSAPLSPHAPCHSPCARTVVVVVVVAAGAARRSLYCRAPRPFIVFGKHPQVSPVTAQNRRNLSQSSGQTYCHHFLVRASGPDASPRDAGTGQKGRKLERLSRKATVTQSSTAAVAIIVSLLIVSVSKVSSLFARRWSEERKRGE